LPEPEFQFESYKMLDYYNLRGVVIFKGTEEARARMVANDAIRLKKDGRKKDYSKSPLDCWERMKKLFYLPEMEFNAYEAKDKKDGFKLFRQEIFKKGERQLILAPSFRKLMKVNNIKKKDLDWKEEVLMPAGWMIKKEFRQYDKLVSDFYNDTSKQFNKFKDLISELGVTYLHLLKKKDLSSYKKNLN